MIRIVLPTASLSESRHCFSRRRIFQRHGHIWQTNSGGCKDGVAHRWRQRHDAGFARACRGQIPAVDEYNFNSRHVAEAWKAVLGEAPIQYAARRKINLFE